MHTGAVIWEFPMTNAFDDAIEGLYSQYYQNYVPEFLKAYKYSYSLLYSYCYSSQNKELKLYTVLYVKENSLYSCLY